jgi:predicted nucleotidyltransferase
VFRAIYSLGLRCVVARLARHRTIHAVLGHGSYFRGTSLYGHSDIDLVIVFRREARRSDGVQYRVARTYDRVRRLFPFLGSWDEKEGSLIFLDEVADGFPPHATFRIRLERGDFVLLHGTLIPEELVGPRVSAADWMLEIDRLLRWAVITGEDIAQRLLFWQRMFSKLKDAAGGLDVEATLEGPFASPDLAFLDQDPRALFFRPALPEDLFSRFLGLVHGVVEAVQATGEPVRLAYRPFGCLRTSPQPSEIPSFAAGPDVTRARSAPSTPIGLQPRLFYFSVDEPMVVVDLEGGAYRGLLSLLKRMEAEGETSDAVIAQVDGLLFLFSKEPGFVDVVPLDPLLCANAYAWLDGQPEFCMPVSVYLPSKSEAEDLFAALAGAYHRHTGRLPKHSYPSIYREDDLDTMRDALDILRAYVAHAHQVSVTSSAELVEYLSERYPGSRGFLAALVEYRAFLERGRRGRPPANNLYRCLHRFVASVLAGAEDIEISDYERRIGITVGIITRNRARDLRNALESLTAQDRVPDEVVIVDNGSTDDTRAVITGFEDRLPLRYVHLAEASIPSARNLVLEHATQEIVSFTDDDCAIPREWLSSVERGFLRADNVGIVGGWVEHWPAEQQTMIDTYYEIFHNHKT